MLKVKPRDGLKIRDPQRGDLIEPEGRTVPRTTYWLHRLRDRDVIAVIDEREALLREAMQPEEKTPAKVITKAPRKPQEITVSVSEVADAKTETA
jgi:hypothetical protein